MHCRDPRRVPVALGSMLAGLLAACGDDASMVAGDSSSSSGSSSSTSATTVSTTMADTTAGESSSSVSGNETSAGSSSGSDSGSGSSSGSDSTGASESSSTAVTSVSESSSSDTGAPAIECPVAVLGPALPAQVFGNTYGTADDVSGSCGGAGSPDVGYQFVAPADGVYTFDTHGSQLDTVLYVLDGDCAGAELGCNDNGDGSQSALALSLTEGQLVTIVVDGNDVGGAPFNLRVRAGTFACPVEDLGNTVPNVVSGDSTQYFDGFESACGGQAGQDAAYLFTAPADGSYTFDTFGSSFESIMYVLDGTCGGSVLACGNEGTLVTLGAGQQVTVVVDTVYIAGQFDLHINGLGGVCPDSDLGNTVPQAVVGDTSDGDNTDAGSCGGAFSFDDLYTFTAPADGLYAFDTFGSALDTVLYVRDGGCGGAELGCNDDFTDVVEQSRVVLGLAASQTVMLGVDGNGIGSYTLNLAQVPCPDEPMPDVPPAVINGSTLGGIDKLRGSCAADTEDYDTPDYAYSFTAPGDGEYTFTTFGSTFDTVLYVLDGAACNGAELACSDNYQFDSSSALSVQLAAGQTVTVVVDGNFEGQGAFTLNVGQLGGGNCPDSDLGNTVPNGATGDTSLGDNTVAGTCGGFTQNDDIYFFTAPNAGLYNFNTVGSAYNTVLFLRDGDCAGAEIACNDDINFFTQQSSIATTLAAGQTVMVAVDGADADGAYDLNIEFVTCPDEVLDNTVPASYDGATIGEVDKLDSPNCPDDGSPDYTFEFTAPADDTYTFDLQGSDYDTVIIVQDAVCGGDELACNDDFFGLQSSVDVNLLQDQTVIIVVSGYSGDSGNFTLNIN